ncbi:transcription termination/antitermination NusG family protein [Chelativorans sp.]|uniref:transcription termination/antitermination protein NusG n=1 Tax=Chelativorans sp. TaxID=2203393 RepID=UPI002811D2DF|nr:transcription termination/antitermination NusG family protein [Chelativorans sp.]
MMAVDAKQLNEAKAINLDRAIEAGRKAQEQARLQARRLSAAAGSEKGEKRWYVLRIAHRSERAVAADLDAAGLEAWAPTKTIWRAVFHSKKRRRAENPIFRGYVFVRSVPCDEAWVGLLRVKGVAAILGNGTRPVHVPDEKMSALMGLVVSGAFDEKKNGRPYKIGEKVWIKDGPFASFPCVIEGYVKSRGVRVLASLFGRRVPLEVTLAQVEGA